MRKAWGSALDQQLVSTAKRLSIGPYELIAEAVRDYLERNGEERDPAQRVPSPIPAQLEPRKEAR